MIILIVSEQGLVSSEGVTTERTAVAEGPGEVLALYVVPEVTD